MVICSSYVQIYQVVNKQREVGVGQTELNLEQTLISREFAFPYVRSPPL